MTVLELPTPHGTARAHVSAPPEAPRGALVLGHGAGGSVGAGDLVAVRDAAGAAGWLVALVEQPYRVAGRRSAPRPPVLDAGWLAVLAGLRDPASPGPLAGVEDVVCGGRSSGARVACRTATQVGATSVLCLAFPLKPPRRATAAVDPPDRLDELDAAGVPTLVVQGAADRFGVPPAAPGRTVAVVPGDHGLKRDVAGIGARVAAWLALAPAERGAPAR